MYEVTTIIAEYNTEESAQRAAKMAQEQFPELASRIAAEDTSDERVSHSWGVTLYDASYTEVDTVNDFLCTNTLTR